MISALLSTNRPTIPSPRELAKRAAARAIIRLSGGSTHRLDDWEQVTGLPLVTLAQSVESKPNRAARLSRRGASVPTERSKNSDLADQAIGAYRLSSLATQQSPIEAALASRDCPPIAEVVDPTVVEQSLFDAACDQFECEGSVSEQILIKRGFSLEDIHVHWPAVSKRLARRYLH